MQHVRALDANKDGYIDHTEFKRLLSADVLRSAAQWVDAMLMGITPASAASTSSGGAGIDNEDEVDDINVDIGIDSAMNEINAEDSVRSEILNESSQTNAVGTAPSTDKSSPSVSPSSRWKLASHAKYCVGERDRHATELVLLAARLTAASNAAQDSIRESAEATHLNTVDEDAEGEGESFAVNEDAFANAGAITGVAIDEGAAINVSKKSKKKTAMGKLKVHPTVTFIITLTLS